MHVRGAMPAQAGSLASILDVTGHHRKTELDFRVDGGLMEGSPIQKSMYKTMQMYQLKNLLKSSTVIVSPLPLYVVHNVDNGIESTFPAATSCIMIPIKRNNPPTMACRIQG